MRLSVNDHAMLHALHALIDAPWDMPDSERVMVLSILRDVLPGVSRGNPALTPLGAQAERLLRARGPIDGLVHGVRESCHEWHRQRLAAAWAKINGD